MFKVGINKIWWDLLGSGFIIISPLYNSLTAHVPKSKIQDENRIFTNYPFHSKTSTNNTWLACLSGTYRSSGRCYRSAHYRSIWPYKSLAKLTSMRGVFGFVQFLKYKKDTNSINFETKNFNRISHLTSDRHLVFDYSHDLFYFLKKK